MGDYVVYIIYARVTNNTVKERKMKLQVPISKSNLKRICEKVSKGDCSCKHKKKGGSHKKEHDPLDDVPLARRVDKTQEPSVHTSYAARKAAYRREVRGKKFMKRSYMKK